MDEQEKSARLIRAEEKVKLANDELEKVKKEEKKRMRKVQDAHKFMMGGNARIALEEAKKALEELAALPVTIVGTIINERNTCADCKS